MKLTSMKGKSKDKGHGICDNSNDYYCSCRTFNNVGVAAYQLFILLTTENYPVSAKLDKNV